MTRCLHWSSSGGMISFSLTKLTSLVISLDKVPDHDPAELRHFLEEKCGKTYRYLRFL